MDIEQEDPEYFNIQEVAQQEKQIFSNKGEKILKPQPDCDMKLTVKILETLQQLLTLKQVRKGVNQILKSITKNEIELVVMAADCNPLEIVMILPSMCKQRQIPFCFISSKNALGRACGIKRPVVAAAVLAKEGSPLQGQILQLKDKIQQLFV